MLSHGKRWKYAFRACFSLIFHGRVAADILAALAPSAAAAPAVAPAPPAAPAPAPAVDRGDRAVQILSLLQRDGRLIDFLMEDLTPYADAQVGAALSLVHQSPEQNWTVQELAQRVAMSRSAFAARFTRMVGEPPLHYVTRWRMQKAASLLRDGQSTIAQIAEAVGYDSEAAFSKAFKRALGAAPGAYRRAARPRFLDAA